MSLNIAASAWLSLMSPGPISECVSSDDYWNREYLDSGARAFIRQRHPVFGVYDFGQSGAIACPETPHDSALCDDFALTSEALLSRPRVNVKGVAA